jgi:hypothetical protein
VTNVQLNDTGNYICEVTIGYRVYKQEHAIEVQGRNSNAPKIYLLIDFIVN